MTNSNVYAISSDHQSSLADLPENANDAITPPGKTPEEQLKHICQYIEFSRKIVLEEGQIKFCISAISGDLGHLHLLSLPSISDLQSLLKEHGLAISSVLPSASKENREQYFPHAGEHPILIIIPCS